MKELSRSFGTEQEFFVIDHEGNISQRGKEVINALKTKIKSTIKLECTPSMIECTTFPHLSSRTVFSDFFDDMETILYEKNNKISLNN